MRGLALGVLLVGVVIAIVRLTPTPRAGSRGAGRPVAPPPAGPIEPVGEALIYRALLMRERGDVYGAYALGRAVASGAAGEVAAERARTELLSEPPPMTIELPLDGRYAEVRFDAEGRVEALGDDQRTLFDLATGETVRHVERRAREPERTKREPGRSLKVRTSEEWRALQQRDLEREGRDLRLMGDRVLVYEGNERVATIESPDETRLTEAALSADGTVICMGNQQGQVIVRDVEGGDALVGKLGGAITAVVAAPANEEGEDDEGPAFLVGTSRGEVARVTRGPERTRWGELVEGGGVVVSLRMLAHDGPPIVWLGADVSRAIVAVDARGVLRWGMEERLGGPMIDSFLVARRVLEWKPSMHRIGVALDPEGGRVAVLRDDTLRVVALEPGLPVCAAPPGDRRAVGRARDGTRVVVRGDEEVVVCDLERPGRAIATFPTRERQRPFGGRTELSADGRRLAISQDARLRVFDVDSGDRVGDISAEWGAKLSADGAVALVDHDLVAVESGLAIRPGCLDGDAGLRALYGTDLMAAFEDDRVVVCELDEDGDEVFRSEAFDGLDSMGTSDDGSHLWVGSEDGKVRLFTLPGGTLVRTLHAGESGGPSAIVANGGGYVMTVSAEGRRRLFATETGERVVEREAPPGMTDGPGTSPETFTGDGAYYLRIGGVRDRAQELWVSATGEKVELEVPDEIDTEVEVRGHAGPLGAGPDAWGTSGHGTAFFRADADGVRTLARVRPGPTAIVGDGRFLVWVGDMVRVVPVGTSGPDAAELTAPLTNHRVCRESFDPVVVKPAEIDDPIWAPDAYCD